MSKEAVTDELFGALARAVGGDVLPDTTLDGLDLDRVGFAGDVIAACYLAVLTRLQNAALTVGQAQALADVIIEAGRVAQAESL